MPMSPDPIDTSRRSTRDHGQSILHSDRAENTHSSTNPPDRAQKSEMEEIRLELELMKRQVRALMGQTNSNSEESASASRLALDNTTTAKNPVADMSGGPLSDNTGRGPRKPEAAGVGHLSQKYTEATEPGVTGGSPEGDYGSRLVLKYSFPSHPPQTSRDREIEKVKADLKKQTAELENYKREVKRLQQNGRTQVTINNILQEDRAKLTDANNSLHHELLSVKKELEEIKTKADTQTPGDSEMEKLKADLKKRTAEFESYQKEVKRLQCDMRTHVTSIDILQADRAKLADANNSMHYELINVKKQLDDITALADTRGKELLAAQKSLTKTDSISISDLEEKVVTLNEEIFQAAVYLAETITHQPHELTKKDASRMYGEVLQLIGEPIVTMLVEEARKPNNDPNPLLVQVVLQVFMTGVCASKMELWIPTDQKISNAFTDLYAKIVDTEEQAMSGQWRALTQKHLTIRGPESTVGWKEDLISSLMKIIKVAAWRIPDKKQRLSFEGKLMPIFKAVEDLRTAMHEKFTSADIRVSLVPPLSQFDARWMDDAFSDARVKVEPNGPRPIQCVVGTTGFGLKKVINAPQPGRSEELLYESVLSPKVTLESTLKEVLQSVGTYMCGKE